MIPFDRAMRIDTSNHTSRFWSSTYAIDRIVVVFFIIIVIVMVVVGGFLMGSGAWLTCRTKPTTTRLFSKTHTVVVIPFHRAFFVVTGDHTTGRGSLAGAVDRVIHFIIFIIVCSI